MIFDIFSIYEGKKRLLDSIEADSVSYTPAGFALYKEHVEETDEIIYGVPTGCIVQKRGE